MSLPAGAFLGDESNVCFVTCLTKRPIQPPLIPPCMSQRGLPRWLKKTHRGPSPWTGPEHGRSAAHADAYIVRASLREKNERRAHIINTKGNEPESHLGLPIVRIVWFWLDQYLRHRLQLDQPSQFEEYCAILLWARISSRIPVSCSFKA